MVELNTDRIIGVFAPSRYGKTNAIASIVTSINTHVFVYDTNKEWANNQILLDLVKRKGNITVFVPDPKKERDINYLNQVIRTVRGKVSNIFFYIEDIECFYNDEKAVNSFFGEIKDLAERGGHQRIGTIYSSKQMKYIPLPLISNANLFYFGQMVEPDDYNKANGIVGKEYDVRKLTKPRFVEMDRWTGQKRYVSFPKIF